MGIAMILNALVFVVLAAAGNPENEYEIRLIAGFFLMAFVLAHGWARYGFVRIAHFFIITLLITWSLETLSIATGFPFGHFDYADTLGIKIGNIPLMIFPAYFFNGYLAWILARIFVRNVDGVLGRKQILTVPLIASVLMTVWNLSFEPIMSRISGHWLWTDSGPYFRVPLSNTVGWLLTTYLVFLGFALLMRRTEPAEQIPVPLAAGYLFPVMYLIQGLPTLLYPFFRQDHAEIFRPVALITLLLMGGAAALNLLVVRGRIPASVLGDTREAPEK